MLILWCRTFELFPAVQTHGFVINDPFFLLTKHHKEETRSLWTQEEDHTLVTD